MIEHSNPFKKDGDFRHPNKCDGDVPVDFRLPIENGKLDLKKKFEGIFGNDPNFCSESENTKSWMFKAFIAGYRAKVLKCLMR